LASLEGNTAEDESAYSRYHHMFEQFFIMYYSDYLVGALLLGDAMEILSAVKEVTSSL
jgi:hypothetical protein